MPLRLTVTQRALAAGVAAVGLLIGAFASPSPPCSHSADRARPARGGNPSTVAARRWRPGGPTGRLAPCEPAVTSSGGAAVRR
jgi:hypothetical protein